MTEQIVGLQLYTVRDETARNFKQTLQRVAEMGYEAVEFAGYSNIPSKDMAAWLADFNLRAIGAHVGLFLLEEDIDREINYCLDIGCSYITLPTLDSKWRSAAGYHTLASRLNEMGEHCQKRGVTLVYHNHDFDFKQDNGQYLLDILLDAADPDLLKLELDTCWAAFAGVDPVTYLRTRAGRVPFIHLKDLTADREFAEIGEGTLDIAAYCKAAQECGTHYYLVENDTPRYPSLESARISLVNLNKILGVQ